MEKSDSTLRHVELKYCERCGGLWLRRKGEERVYCVTCVPKMDEMPVPRRRSTPRFERPPADLEIDGSALELCAVVEGGQS